jgi:hypothetical protein
MALQDIFKRSDNRWKDNITGNCNHGSLHNHRLVENRQINILHGRKEFHFRTTGKITYDPSKPLNIPAKIQDLVESIQKSDLLPLELKRVFLMYANESIETFNAVKDKVTSEVDLFRGKIENWFDTSMQRVGGSFKSRYMRPWTFVVAALAAILLNADSMSIAKYLYSNPDARVKLASQAMSDVKDSSLQHYSMI